MIRKPLTAHELARLLLAGPDLPVATHANNHTADSRERIRVCRGKTFGCNDSVIIGNISRRRINASSVDIADVLDGGELADDWGFEHKPYTGPTQSKG